MMMQHVRSDAEMSIGEAVALYHRLRQRGQRGILARLSVEARCGTLPLHERLWLHRLLSNLEAQCK